MARPDDDNKTLIQTEQVRPIQQQGRPAQPNTVMSPPPGMAGPQESSTPQSAPPPSAPPTHTQVIFPTGDRKPMPDTTTIGGATTPVISRPDGPIVGWLVVVGGPGRGNAKEISAGLSFIGREEGRIVINYGDESISRSKAATIIFDVESSAFFLSGGEGVNPARRNGELVMAPVQLSVGDTIKIGMTELRFVPLCGPDFSWTEKKE